MTVLKWAIRLDVDWFERFAIVDGGGSLELGGDEAAFGALQRMVEHTARSLKRERHPHPADRVSPELFHDVMLEIDRDLSIPERSGPANMRLARWIVHHRRARIEPRTLSAHGRRPLIVASAGALTAADLDETIIVEPDVYPEIVSTATSTFVIARKGSVHHAPDWVRVIEYHGDRRPRIFP